MKLTITFELPKDFTEEERENFKDDLRSSAVESIKNIFEYRAREVSEQVAESIKIEETK